MRKCRFIDLLLLVLGLSMANPAIAQTGALLDKADTLKYSDPNEAIKIEKYQLKNSDGPENRARARLLLSETYIVKGNYAQAIKNVYGIQDLQALSLLTRIRADVIKAKLLRILFLDDQSQRQLDHARLLFQQLPSDGDKLRFEIGLEQISLDLKAKRYRMALNKTDSLQGSFDHLVKKNSELAQKLYGAKAEVLQQLGDYEMSSRFYAKAMAELKRHNPQNYFRRAKLYMGMGDLAIALKDYRSANGYLLNALKYAKILDNTIILRSINQRLATTSLALNDGKTHKDYNNIYLILTNTVENMDQEAINMLFSLINETQNSELTDGKTHWAYYRYGAGAIFSIVFLVCLGFYIRSYWRKKRYREILNYLEVGKNVSTLQKIPSKDSRVNIPEEREKILLDKLKRFEQTTRFLSKDMSLAVLAGYLDTNTKYLSEIIKRRYQHNFSTYINKLRIQFIIEKLRTDSNYKFYKISYLADECGFSSHSSFSTVFKSIVGISPAKFINLLNKDNKKPGKNT